MANRKKEVYKPKPMTEGKRNLIQGLLQEYDIQSADDIQEALKDLFSGTIQDMLETEMDNHLGYDRYERSDEPNGNLIIPEIRCYFNVNAPFVTVILLEKSSIYANFIGGKVE